ncbi:hypothetical protein QFZ94_006104 [Paraburkholderia sp. JPY465]
MLDAVRYAIASTSDVIAAWAEGPVDRGLERTCGKPCDEMRAARPNPVPQCTTRVIASCDCRGGRLIFIQF